MARRKPSTPLAAYPQVIVREDTPSGEPALSPAFHEQHLAHLIGKRQGSHIWPDDPDDALAVACFKQGQHALYQDKDMVQAIRAYESAIDRAPGYLKAWVALAIAYISDNTPSSLERADEVLGGLAALPPDDWLTREASSIIHQNLAYLHVHRYRNDDGTDAARRSHLDQAEREYQIADDLADDARIEYLCPWTYVKLERGESDAAHALWQRAQAHVAKHNASRLLEEYAAKYAPLRKLLFSH